MRWSMARKLAVRPSPGEGRTKTTWLGMKQRCLNPNCVAYPSYGGRGIGIDQRWLTFTNFLADMGERPDGMSIERLHNDGDYRPGNCVWATAGEQAANKRNTAPLMDRISLRHRFMSKPDSQVKVYNLPVDQLSVVNIGWWINPPW